MEPDPQVEVLRDLVRQRCAELRRSIELVRQGFNRKVDRRWIQRYDPQAPNGREDPKPPAAAVPSDLDN